MRTGLDRRAWPGLVGGLLGLALSIAGGFFSSPVLGVLGGCAALIAGASCLPLLAAARVAEASAPARATSGPTPIDAETGLPDEWYFGLHLDGRIAAARRVLEPLSVTVFEIDFEPSAPPAALRGAVDVLRSTLRESDLLCRLGARCFGLVLEKTTEEGAARAAERLRGALLESAPLVEDLVAGVASYPTHGLTAADVLAAARRALVAAASSQDSRVAVAGAD